MAAYSNARVAAIVLSVLYRMLTQKRAWGLRKLGVDSDLARLTSFCGDRYEWIVRRTCVPRAISKDVLTRRGLVSCLDYYLIRHSLKTN